MKDTGKRKEYATGAVREDDPQKIRPDLISPIAMTRLAGWLAVGARKYTDRNWEKGIPLSRTFASLYRHVIQIHSGDTSEDHEAAVMCNAMMMMHTREMISRGKLPKELDDMPRYAI